MCVWHISAVQWHWFMLGHLQHITATGRPILTADAKFQTKAACSSPIQQLPSVGMMPSSRSICNTFNQVPKQHHKTNLGELCSFLEPGPDMAASQRVQDMGVRAQDGCAKTGPTQADQQTHQCHCSEKAPAIPTITRNVPTPL